MALTAIENRNMLKMTIVGEKAVTTPKNKYPDDDKIMVFFRPNLSDTTPDTADPTMYPNM